MRICVTGIGIVSPLGCGIKPVFQKLLNKACGIVHLGPEYEGLPSQIGGRVVEFNKDNFFTKTELRRLPTFAQYAVGASLMALEDAKLDLETPNPEKRGVAIGSGIGGFEAAYDNSVAFHTSGYHKVSPLFVPSLLSNMAAGHVSIRTNFQGPNHSVATACTTGAHAIGDAYNMMKLGMADVMLAGSTEAAIHPLSVAGFARAKSLASKYNSTPEAGSRPFDKERDGFVIGEGAAVLLLETEEHAKARNAKVYATIEGYGMSGDANHITAPHSSGRGAKNCMKMALGALDGSKVGYVNAHATSTQLGDMSEAGAISEILPNAAVSSTKGSTGHLLGAAGSLESAFTIMALHEQVLPPCINLENPEGGLDYVLEKRKGDVEYAMSNSFGFGGTNASLLFKRYVE